MPADAAPARVSRARRGPASTAAYLRRCLELVRERDLPRYRELRAHIRRVPASYRVGAERFTVVADRDRIKVTSRSSPTARVDVATTAPDILQLVDGTSSLTRLLAEDRLRIWGDAEALLDLSAAVRVFSLAATGSGLIQREFEAFRSWVLNQPIESR